MNNLQKLIELAKADGGKFYVIDEKGNPVLVIMPVSEYEKILLRKLEKQSSAIEEINNKIAEAQKEQRLSKKQIEQEQLKSEVIDSTFSFEQAENLPLHSEIEDI